MNCTRKKNMGLNFIAVELIQFGVIHLDNTYTLVISAEYMEVTTFSPADDVQWLNYIQVSS